MTQFVVFDSLQSILLYFARMFFERVFRKWLTELMLSYEYTSEFEISKNENISTFVCHDIGWEQKVTADCFTYQNRYARISSAQLASTCPLPSLPARVQMWSTDPYEYFLRKLLLPASSLLLCSHYTHTSKLTNTCVHLYWCGDCRTLETRLANAGIILNNKLNLIKLYTNTMLACVLLLL